MQHGVSGSADPARTDSRGRRTRMSLPVAGSTATPPATGPQHARLHGHTIPRRAHATPKLSRPADERPGAAMFDRLFSASPLVSSLLRPDSHRGHNDMLTPAHPYPHSHSLDDRQQGGPQQHQGNALTSLFDDDEQTDEISVLGVEHTDVSPERHVRLLTPDRFLDDISMKMESPGNMSIGKMMDEFEQPEKRSSPLRVMLDAVRATTRPLATTTTAVVAPSDEPPSHDIVPDVLEDASERATTIAPLHQSPPPLEVEDMPEAQIDVPVIGDRHVSRASPIEQDQQTEGERKSPHRSATTPPDKLHTYLPFADEDYINTPARPMEEPHWYHDFGISTPIKPAPPPSSKFNAPPTTQKVASQDISSRSHVSFELAPDDPNAETSFASTVADFAIEPKIVPVRRAPAEAGSPRTSERLDNDAQTADDRQSDPLPTPTRTAKSGQRRTISVEPASASKHLGSAIRIGEAHQESFNDQHQHEADRPLIMRAPTMVLSEPRRAAMGAARTVKPCEDHEEARPTTPPARLRLRMDIPLTRPTPSVEIWENPIPAVRLAAQGHRSPSPEILPNGLETPPPGIRRSMDVPLSRKQEPEEIWQGAEARPRRTLLSPGPRRRSLSSVQLTVEESPQITCAVDDSVPPGTPGSRSRHLPTIPKLNFGLGHPVSHSRSLSGNDDSSFFVPVRHAGHQNPQIRENLGNADEGQSKNDSALTSTTRQIDGSISATPRVSKLRRLAKSLEDSQDDSDFLQAPVPHASTPESPQMTPRTLRRKELSDDIVLEFAAEPEYAEADQDLHQPDAASPEPEHAGVGPVGPRCVMVDTPILTLKRKRAQLDTPLSPSASPAPESRRASSTGQANRRTRHAKPKAARVGDALAFFGAAPQVLPRSRRERKKPVEYWKVSSAVEQEDLRPVPSLGSAVSPGHQAVRSMATKPPELAVSGGNETSEAASLATKPVRKRKRPSEIVGPVSKHYKISATSIKKSTDKSTSIGKARVHNFEDSE